MTIGKFCREFRTTVLKKRLVDLAPDTIGTLSAFEHGSSTNMKHLATYLRLQAEKRNKMKKQTTVKSKATNIRMDRP